MRFFVVLTRRKAPLMLEMHRRKHAPAASFLDFSAGKCSRVGKPGRTLATLQRVAKGSGLTGRDTSRPIGNITTLHRWALVRGDEMRMLSADEALAVMSFPLVILRPINHRQTTHMAGSAIPPLAEQRIIQALISAA